MGRSFLKLSAGEALARGIAFLATVYLARRLGAPAYGMIVVATAILLYATAIVESGIDTLGVHDVAREPSRLAVLLPDYLSVRLLVALALVGVLGLAGLAAFPQPDGAILALYALVLLPVALGTRWAHLGLERSGTASLARVLTEGLAALVIVAGVHGPGDAARAPLATLLGEATGAFLLLRLLPRGSGRLRPAFRLAPTAELLRRSWPVVAHTLLGLLIFNSDFFFLRGYRDAATVGYYAVAYTLVSFFLNLGSAYTLSLLPALARLREQPASEAQLYQSALAQVFAGALPIALGGSLLAAALVQLLFGAAYAPAGAPLQILLWCIPVGLLRSVAHSALIARGRQDRLLRSVAWAAGINLALNAALIPRWGMAGAAMATITTETVRAALALHYCGLGGLRFPSLRRFWRVLVAGGLMGGVLALAGIGARWLAIPVGGLVYLLGLYLVGGLSFRRGALPELTV